MKKVFIVKSFLSIFSYYVDFDNRSFRIVIKVEDSSKGYFDGHFKIFEDFSTDDSDDFDKSTLIFSSSNICGKNYSNLLSFVDILFNKSLKNLKLYCYESSF